MILILYRFYSHALMGLQVIVVPSENISATFSKIYVATLAFSSINWMLILLFCRWKWLQNDIKVILLVLNLRVISRAEEIGNRAAAREFEVDERCIRRWRSEKADIEKMPLQKRSRRSGIVKWPNLENILAKWIKKQKENGISVSTVKIRLQAALMVKQMNINYFKGESCWCYRFKKQKNFLCVLKRQFGNNFQRTGRIKKHRF